MYNQPSNPDLAELTARHGHLDGAPLLRLTMRDLFPGRIAAVSSFGAESVVLLNMIAQIDPALPVIFLDTGQLFDETLEYVETLRRRLGLSDLRIQRPAPARIATEDPDGILWQSNSNACCHFRKVAPLNEALSSFSAWITGRKRFHGGERSNLAAMELADGRVKVNPLTNWPAQKLEAYMQDHALPRHPLAAEGYLSIGCGPCTSIPENGASARAGRWAGLGKTECGIHTAKWYKKTEPSGLQEKEPASC